MPFEHTDPATHCASVVQPPRAGVVPFATHCSGPLPGRAHFGVAAGQPHSGKTTHAPPPVGAAHPHVPALQTSLPAQTVLQSPQCFGSLRTLISHPLLVGAWRSPLQSAEPDLHVRLHVPSAHDAVVCGASQSFVHRPQLCSSLVRSEQESGQLASDDGHPHVPCVHIAPLLQAFPHAPQLARSVVASVHAPPQSVLPCAQAQLPPVQISAEEQLLPHPPQFAGSESVATHVPPQHDEAASHALPHAPQLALSVCRLTQALLHWVRASPQRSAGSHSFRASHAKPLGHLPSAAQGNGPSAPRSVAQAPTSRSRVQATTVQYRKAVTLGDGTTGPASRRLGLPHTKLGRR